MSLREAYRRLGDAARLDQDAANRIVEAAKPRALDALGRSGDPPGSLRVSARLVGPAAQRGGSLIPAWPSRRADGSVTIDFVEDWGVLLAAWRADLDEPPAETAFVDALLASRERLWVGIANDVLQMYVPDPPPDTYSMVRHHALMLAAATLWLGPDAARRWHHGHALAARAFLRRLDGRPLWDAVGRAEQGLQRLLDDPRSKADAEGVVAWLDADPDAAAAYRSFLGAAGLGVAALLEAAPEANRSEWVRRTVFDEHPRADFNRAPIERLAARLGLAR